MKIVKPFKSGNSQAIRIPKEFRFQDDETVVIRKEGNRIILESENEWPQELLSILGSGTETLPRSKQRHLSDIRNPFA